MKAIRSFAGLLFHALVGNEDATRSSWLESIQDALAFFFLVAAACGLTAIYATIVGAW